MPVAGAQARRRNPARDREQPAWNRIGRVSGFPQGQAHLDSADVLYDPALHSRPLSTIFGLDFTGFLTFRSYARWALGRPEAARADVERGIRDARAIGHGYTLMTALHITTSTQIHLGNVDAAKAQAGELVALAQEKSAPAFIAHGMADQSCALAFGGEAAKAVPAFEHAIAYDRALSSTVEIPGCLSVLAKAHADLGQFGAARRCIGEAIALAEASGEAWWEADLHRTAGEFELMAPDCDAAKAQTCLERALEISRVQQARSFELRAAMGLARLWRDQGRASEAHDLLAPVYGWFTEGFETPDLIQARSLLEDVAAGCAAQALSRARLD